MSPGSPKEVFATDRPAAEIFIPGKIKLGLIQINPKYTNLLKFTKVTNSDMTQI